MSSYSVYILYSKKIDRYYIGHTDNLEIRLLRHNSGFVRWTSHGTPWILVYSESHETRSSAVLKERKIKSRKNRAYIEELIKTASPQLNGRVPRSGINHQVGGSSPSSGIKAMSAAIGCLHDCPKRCDGIITV